MVKLLICGAVSSDAALGDLFHRAGQLNRSAHGPFDCMFCVGGFDVKLQTLQATPAPLPTYVISCLLGSGEEGADGGEKLADNVTFLGNTGVQEIHGLTVVYVSGGCAETDLEDASPAHYTSVSIEKLCKNLREQNLDVDLLLTNEFGKGYHNFVPSNLLAPLEEISGSPQNLGSPAIASVAMICRPRYHVGCSQGPFFQRPPYMSDEMGKTVVTRFIALGKVNKTADKSHKWLHALNLQPSAKMTKEQLSHVPSGTTENPYGFCSQPPELYSERCLKRQRYAPGMDPEQIQLLKEEFEANNQNHFFFDPNARGMHGCRRGRGNDRRGKGGWCEDSQRQEAERTDCWFCLATPDLETHLIVSVGQESYLAIPKGSISHDHILIIPIVHIASIAQASDEALEEITKFKEALRKYFSAQRMSCVVFERNVKTRGAAHCHLQVVPVPDKNVPAARQTFELEGAKRGMAFEELDADTKLSTVAGNEQYFYVEVPTEGTVVRLFHRIISRHYIHFGREVCAIIIGKPGRADWKACTVPMDQEQAMASTFKERFQPFHPRLPLEEQ